MEINYQGYTIPINERLLEEQDAWGNVGKIVKARILLMDLLDFEAEAFEAGLLDYLPPSMLSEQLTKYEYRLQEAWNFPKDDRFHTYHMYLKACTCPKMDNQELIGTNRRIVSMDCPYHGKYSLTK